jgi:hypothetical protein
MAEQDAFDQIVRDRAAVDGDERLARRSLAAWMARATSSLPTPDSPSMRIGMFGGGGLLRQLQHLFHRRASGRDILEGWQGRTPRQLARPIANGLDLHCVGYGFVQALRRGRLDHEIECAVPHGVDDRLDAALRGLDDDRRCQIALAHFPQHADAVECPA